MNQLTIRGFNPELQRRMQALAQEKNISLNKAALYFLHKGADLEQPAQNSQVVGDSLDSFIGSWSAQDEAEFLQSIQDCEQVDDAFWR